MMEEKIIKEGKISIVTIIIRLVIDLCACMIIIGFFWVVRDIIKFLTTKLTITDKRLNGKTGLINTNELDSPLNKINGVQVKQKLFGKIFNYGTISVTTASTVFNFDYIDHPNEFKNLLNNQIEIYEDDRMQKQAQKMAEAMKK